MSSSIGEPAPHQLAPPTSAALLGVRVTTTTPSLVRRGEATLSLVRGATLSLLLDTSAADDSPSSHGYAHSRELASTYMDMCHAPRADRCA